MHSCIKPFVITNEGVSLFIFPLMLSISEGAILFTFCMKSFSLKPAMTYFAICYIK